MPFMGARRRRVARGGFRPRGGFSYYSLIFILLFLSNFVSIKLFLPLYLAFLLTMMTMMFLRIFLHETKTIPWI